MSWSLPEATEKEHWAQPDASVTESIGMKPEAPWRLRRIHPWNEGWPAVLGRDDRGLASLEYIIILSTVVVGLCVALLSWWQPAFEWFAVQVAWLALPLP